MMFGSLVSSGANPASGPDRTTTSLTDDVGVESDSVDRLTFGGKIVKTGTASYRLPHTLAHRTAS